MKKHHPDPTSELNRSEQNFHHSADYSALQLPAFLMGEGNPCRGTNSSIWLWVEFLRSLLSRARIWLLLRLEMLHKTPHRAGSSTTTMPMQTSSMEQQYEGDTFHSHVRPPSLSPHWSTMAFQVHSSNCTERSAQGPYLSRQALNYTLWVKAAEYFIIKPAIAFDYFTL